MSYCIVLLQRRSEGDAEGLAAPGGTDQGRQTGVKTRANPCISALPTYLHAYVKENYRERLFMFVCLFVFAFKEDNDRCSESLLP